MRQIWVFYFYSPDNLCKFRLCCTSEQWVSVLSPTNAATCLLSVKCSPHQTWKTSCLTWRNQGILFDVKVSAKSAHARHQSAVWNCGTQALVCGSAIYTSLKLLKSPSVCSHSLPSEKNAKRQSSFIRPVLCLCWIPRHSPKVVKAASQVLSSMWQYRDLRSLYKKVKSPWLS